MNKTIFINEGLSLKLELDESSPTENKQGYFSFIIKNVEFGDFTVYTYLEMIISEFEKILKHQDVLYPSVFRDKSNEDIFNLIYKLTTDWDYYESISTEQAEINVQFFRNNIWNTEESLDKVMIYVIFKNECFEFLFKNFNRNNDMYNTRLVQCKVNREELIKILNIFYKLIPRDREYLDIFRTKDFKN